MCITTMTRQELEAHKASLEKESSLLIDLMTDPDTMSHKEFLDNCEKLNDLEQKIARCEILLKFPAKIKYK